MNLEPDQTHEEDEYDYEEGEMPSGVDLIPQAEAKEAGD